MPLQRLDEAAGVREVHGTVKTGESRGRVVRTHRWFQFAGQEHVTEFDEAHFKLEGQFQQNSSTGHKDYQDRLRASVLRKEGMEKAAIARALGRSEKFVAKWWQKDKDEIDVPYGVHAYLTKDMGRNENGVGATSNAEVVDSSSLDAATHWRDVEIRRNFAVEPEIYNEIVENTDWKGSPARTRDFATGGSHAKYDRYGKMRMFGHQGGKYEHGISPALDKCMQRLFAEYGIADRTSGVITNWYPDGDSYLGSHRHDCWTALFSFGHERILTMDNTPLLMQHGDLVIFGTQRHGVPFMPDIKEGRITVVVFFYPDSMQKKMMWQTITDPETMAPSRPLVAMLKEKHLGAAAEQRAIEARPGNDLQNLMELGFGQEDAQEALRSAKFDVERAVELLLMSGKGGNDLINGDGYSSDIKIVERSSGWRNRARTARDKDMAAEEASLASCSTAASSSSGAGSSSTASGSNSVVCSGECCDHCDDDEMMARQLYLEDAGLFGSVPDDHTTSDSELAALAAHFEEIDAAEGRSAMDPALLAAQFDEYDTQFKRDDSERWNGVGDLMLGGMARENLTIEDMDKVTIYSVGPGDMLEKDFYEMLQCHSIRVLYDIRPTDYRGELYSRHKQFSVASLRSSCRSRGILFKSMPLGKESAYGTLAHIKSDEGKHTLVELVWQAKRRHTAFMGVDELWRHDARQVAADVLSRAGHTVEHIRSDGSVEHHEIVSEFPDWLIREEDRLRLLEKKRQAGDLEKPQKSRIDRSSEVVAAKLARPAEEVDAMLELKGAANQKELVVAQRKLARYQRIAEEKGALAAKVVKAVPSWIMEDAQKQAEWVAEKKKQKAQGEASGSVSTDKSGDSSTAAASTACAADMDGSGDSSYPATVEVSMHEEDLQVECLGCGIVSPWQDLQTGDGVCAACLVGAAEVMESSKTDIAQVEPALSSIVVATEPEAPQRSAWRGRRARNRQDAPG